MKQFKLLAILAVFAILGMSLTACSEEGDKATSTQSCAFRIGDGEDGRDANIKEVYYPNQVIHRDQNGSGGFNDEVKYFPCNPRNFIVNDGKVKDVEGRPVGDRFTRTEANVDGAKVLISWKMFWQVNQGKSVLTDEFYPFCAKYDCYSGSADANDANYSDSGWNGMLAENNSQAGDAVLRDGVGSSLTYEGVAKHDSAEWKALAEFAGNNFADYVRPYTGYADDLFCGSGSTSGWEDPKNPGEGTYTCGNVRFVIDKVEFADSTLQDLADREKKADKEAATNTAELTAAKNKYGENAGYWLGLMDTIKQCNENTRCVISLGGNGGTNVNAPEGPTK